MNIAVALAAGLLLDLLFGDPRWLPHPVVAIGRMIAFLEQALRRIFPSTAGGKRLAGATLVVMVVGVVFIATSALLLGAHDLHPWFGEVVETFFCYQILACRGLRDAGLKVWRALASGDIEGARAAVSEVVGRDVDRLDGDGIARAAVETVAENASDGVVAPMLYFAIGGAPLAMAYKAVNTMDSMLGYKNDKYIHFGRFAARLDDMANYLPARLTAFLMVPSAWLCRLDWRNAFRIYRRDRTNHTSPNSGHPEAAAAGALGVRLGGDSYYSGIVVRKPSIGEALRDIEPDDIRYATRLLYATAVLALVLFSAVRLGILFHLMGINS